MIPIPALYLLMYQITLQHSDEGAASCLLRSQTPTLVNRCVISFAPNPCRFVVATSDALPSV